MEQVHQKRKGIISIFLVVCTLSMFAVMSFPVGAVATETIIIGGAITAMALASGISLVVHNTNAQEYAQYVYDKFAEWYEHRQAELTLAEIATQLYIDKGKLAIKNGIAQIFGEYIEQMQSWDVVQLMKPFNGFAGKSLPVINRSAEVLPYLRKIPKNYVSGDVITITGTWSDGVSTFYAKYNYNSGINGWNMTYTSEHTGNSHTLATNGGTAPDVVGYNNAQGDNKLWLCWSYASSIGQTPDGNLSLTAVYENTSGSYRNVRYSQISTISYNSNNKKQMEITTGTIESNPLDTLQDDENVYVTVPTVAGTNIYDYTNSVVEGAVANELTATYENAVSLDPVTPATNMKWVTGFHDIWKYVRYFIEKAGTGIQAFGQILSELPQEVTWVFYGAFILLIFGGVISILLQ